MLRLVIGQSTFHQRIIVTLAATVLLVRTDASGNPSAALRSQPVSSALEFETNTGQFAPEVLYLARSSNHFVYLTRNSMTLAFTDAPQRDTSLRMMLVGANRRPSITGEARMAGVSNYLIGNDPAKWRRGVTHFGRVRYSGVWPGIDLLFHGRDQSLEYDFVVYPGRDPAGIRLRYENVQSLRLDAEGDLILERAQGEVRQRRPEIYQVSAGVRHILSGGYRIVNGREVRFEVQKYDRSLPLVIDPVLTYSTYLGGNGTAKLNGMALDSTGNLYLTGRVSSPDFPISGSVQAPSGVVGLYRSQDRAATWAITGSGIGLAKVLALAADPQSNAVLYAGTSHGIFKTADGGLTWKSSSGLPNDTVTTVALDPTNPSKVYAGMSAGLYQSTDGGNTWKSILATSVVSVAAAATRAGVIYAGRASAPILRSTDGGASWQEVGTAVLANALAVDPTNASIVYAATSRSGVYRSTDGGTTWAFSNIGLTSGATPLTVYTIAIDPRIPQRLYAATANGLFRSSDGGAGWTPAGTGIGTRSVLSLAINPQDANFAYAGTAGAGIFRTTDGGDTWTSTGPANLDANAVAVDAGGVFVYSGLYVGTQGFVTKINSSGNALVYSTYIGGAGASEGRAIAVDGAGHAYVCGATDAVDFPTRNAYQASIGGSRDAFFLRLNAAGFDLDYSSFLGGHGDDVCEGLALDPNGNLYLAGNTYARSSGPSANDFPTSPGGFQRSSPGGGQDCFVSKFDDSGRRLTYSTYLGGSSVDGCFGLAVDRFGNAYLSGMTTSPNFPLTQSSLGGTIPSPPVLQFSSSFVTRLNSDGTDLSYSALLGGLKGDSEVDGLALDLLGRVYLTGYTKASDFPLTANTLSRVIPQRGKTIVSVVNPNSNALVYSTLLPGTGPDAGWKIQFDAFGNAWVIGTAYSSQFPATPDAIVHPATSDPTPFVAELDVTASKLLHATYLAGTAGGTGSAIALSPDGTVFVAGSTLSTDFPVQGGPFQTAKSIDYAIFVPHLDFAQSAPVVSPAIAAVVNGASFAGGALAPGEAITISGTNLANTTAQFTSAPPTTLGGTSVSINGQNIPLFYVSPTQINAQLPFEIPAGGATLKVTANGVTSTAASITVAAAAPGIFLVGTNRAAATNPNGSVNTSVNPAAAGDIVTVYFTGIGPLDHPVATGEPAPLGGPLSRATLPVTITIGGQLADVLYVGLTPGSISLAQANVVAPNLPSGDYPIAIKVGSAVSNTPMISITSK
jgi:uncharacterized protein (TIGR03437 family)